MLSWCYWPVSLAHSMNIGKTKELVVDFSQKQPSIFMSLSINGVSVERVSSFRYPAPKHHILVRELFHQRLPRLKSIAESGVFSRAHLQGSSVLPAEYLHQVLQDQGNKNHQGLYKSQQWTVQPAETS